MAQEKVDTAAARRLAEEIELRALEPDRPMTAMMVEWARMIWELADALDAAPVADAVPHA